MKHIFLLFFLAIKIASYSQCNGPLSIDLVIDYADCSDPNSGVITLLTQDPDSVTYSINGASFVNTPQFSNLSPGTYNFTINDTTGCTTTASGVIPLPLDIDYVNVTTSCNSVNTGMINLNGLDGFPIYQYSFNGGLTFDTSSTENEIGPGVYQVVIKDSYDCEVDTMITVNSFPTISPTITTTNEQCNGSGPGSVDFLLDGATYDFSLDGAPITTGTNYNNAAILAGYYVLEITDVNGCTSPFQFQVGADLVDDSVHINHEYCHYGNGDIEVFGFLGTTPYEYSINNGTTYFPVGTFNNLAQGDHQILIKDATGCIKTDSIYVTNFGGIIATPSLEDTICTGTSAFVSVSHNGGINTTYQWDNGLGSIQTHTVSPSITTSYTVIVTDGYGCKDTVETTVYVETIPILSLSQTNLQACIGDSIQLQAFGATNYIWSTGDTTDVMNYVAVGNETISVTGYNGQCTDTEQMVIIIKPSPTAIASANATSINTGDSIFFFSNGSITSTTTWNFGDGFSSMETNPYHSFDFPGAYYAVLTSEMGGCEATDTVLVYVGTVSINELNKKEVLMFPNPTTSNFNIQIKEKSNVSIINLNGAIVYTSSLIPGSNEISTDNFAKGIYLVYINSSNENLTLKLVVN